VIGCAYLLSMISQIDVFFFVIFEVVVNGGGQGGHVCRSVPTFRGYILFHSSLSSESQLPYVSEEVIS
jgi:hypothetical protein